MCNYITTYENSDQIQLQTEKQKINHAQNMRTNVLALAQNLRPKTP